MDDEPVQGRLQSPAKQNLDERKQRPPINLGNGLDDPKRRNSKLNIKEDIANSNSALRSFGAGSRSGSQAVQRSTSAESNTHQRRKIMQPNTDYFQSYVKQPEQTGSTSPKLSDKFVRDEQPRSRASQRMKSLSQNVSTRVSPIRDSFGSVDELSGEKTVGSQVSGSVSPKKQDTRKEHTHTDQSINGRQFSESPADLLATQFKQSGRRTLERSAHAHHPQQSEDDGPETERVKIKAFYATSCALDSGNMELWYDERNSGMYLYCDNSIVRVPGKNIVISISDTEARLVSYHKGSNKVYLRGSQSESNKISNGHICIAFMDWKGVEWFLDRIDLITRDTIASNHVDEMRIDKLFATQAAEISKSFNRENERRLHEKPPALSRTNPQVIRSAQKNDDEEIKYEPFEQQENSGRSDHWDKLVRQNASVGRGSRNAAGLESSPYFTDTEARRSTRQAKPRAPTPPPPKRWTMENKIERWAHSVVYPPEGVKRVTVDFQDLERLDEGELLNDNIISFAMRRIEETMTVEHRESVFFFNSFFYTALTIKNGRRSFNYDAVKRWTKNTDLMKVPYVVVPINIDYHWFVVIICNLPNISRRALGLEDDVEVEEQADGAEVEVSTPNHEDTGLLEQDEPGPHAAQNLLIDAHPDEIVAKANLDDAATSDALNVDAESGKIHEQTAALSQLSLSPDGRRQELLQCQQATEKAGQAIAADVQNDLENSQSKAGSSHKKTKKRGPPPPRKYDPGKPTIITLDSFGGTHSQETRNLKDYLKAEAEAKRGIDLNTQHLQGMTAKGLPEQTNFCDCGVYLVGYIEEFAKDPKKFVTKVLTRQLDKQADFASFDPSAKRAEIRNELLKLHAEQDAERRAKKAAKKAKPQDTTTTAAAPPLAQRQGLYSRDVPSGEDAAAAQTGPKPPAPFESSMSKHMEQRETHPRVSERKEDESELELSVPRPFEEPSTPDAQRREAIPITEKVHYDEQEEMLDSMDGTDEASYQAVKTSPHSPRSEGLIDPLLGILNAGLPPPLHPTKQPDGADTASYQPSEKVKSYKVDGQASQIRSTRQLPNDPGRSKWS